MFVPKRNKNLPLDREEVDLTHTQMAVYKGRIGNFVLR